jgi:hypothetical protein
MGKQYLDPLSFICFGKLILRKVKRLRDFTNNKGASFPSTSFGSKDRFPFKINSSILCVFLLQFSTLFHSHLLIYSTPKISLTLFLVLWSLGGERREVVMKDTLSFDETREHIYRQDTSI